MFDLVFSVPIETIRVPGPQLSSIRGLSPTKYSCQKWSTLTKLPLLTQPATRSMETLSTFSFNDLFLKMEGAAPNLMRLLSTLANVSLDTSNKAAQHRNRRCIAMILSQLSNLGNERRNYVQSIVGYYLYSSGVGKRALTCFNHLGWTISYSALQKFISDTAEAENQLLKNVTTQGICFASGTYSL